MSPITGSAEQPGDRKNTVKDNQKNVIAVPTAPEISESPAQVVGLSLVQAPIGLCFSAAGFKREGRCHAPRWMDENVSPHADQKAQGLEGFDLSFGYWRRAIK